ncbi:MAG: aminopeptidase [Candidatus Zixiibacteriota bacterium]
MNDPRNDKLADVLVNYSCRVKKGELVVISVKGDSARDLGFSLIRKVTEVGGVPFWMFSDDAYMRQFCLKMNDKQLKRYASLFKKIARDCDCYISIAGANNPFEMTDIPPKTKQMIRKDFYQPVMSNIITKSKKWVAVRYPDYAMAQLAKQPQEKFANFYYDVCCVNYAKMSKAMDPLVKLMKKTDKVHIKGKGTDLTFSIKGINVIKCDGEFNIPDGEVFTAPVKNSVNGVISFNTASLYEGSLFTDIRFEFKNGKIIKAACSNNNEKLNKHLDTDAGARYIGEFAIGVNPMIKEPMMDTLFDEKIDGSFHFTPGACYDEADNGNKSAIHWDLVCIQRPDYGGGEIWFDGKLIRKNGKFVHPQLKNKFTRKALV